MSRHLIFVYNADSGLFNTVTDIAHKILLPDTYSCNLCALTHGHFKVRDSWVKYLQQADGEFAFLHKDEFIKQHGDQGVGLPAIFELKDDELYLMLGPDDINNVKNINQLIDLIEK